MSLTDADRVARTEVDLQHRTAVNGTSTMWCKQLVKVVHLSARVAINAKLHRDIAKHDANSRHETQRWSIARQVHIDLILRRHKRLVDAACDTIEIKLDTVGSGKVRIGSRASVDRQQRHAVAATRTWLWLQRHLTLATKATVVKVDRACAIRRVNCDCDDEYALRQCRRRSQNNLAERASKLAVERCLDGRWYYRSSANRQSSDWLNSDW